MQLLRDCTWTPTSELRNADPQVLCLPTTVPRLAREESYAKDIIDAWNEHFHHASSESSRKYIDTLGSPFPYKGPNGDAEFSGYLIIPSTVDVNNIPDKLPVVIIFHTGAGPQDIFNRFQADKLARESCWGDTGCIIFVADVVSDFVGWTWGDRERYWNTRKDLLEVTERDGHKRRWKLRDTVAAAMDAVKSIDAVDTQRIVAWGFCLGGQPVVELGRMQCDGLKGLITFHGIFDGIDLPDKEDKKDNETRRVLICNGLLDPHVPMSDIDTTKETFERCGWNCEVLNFENAQHNFSNPRTKYDDSDGGFGYDEHASTKGWTSALELIKDVFEL